MSGLRISLLGAPLLECEDEPIKLDTRKNLALVAYLAVMGETHTREALATLLWPETDPSRARAGLRRNLSVLKKALRRRWLVVDRESVGTDPGVHAWLDVARFHELLAPWQGHGRPERPPDMPARPAVLNDRYRLGEELGWGSIGVVYRAHDLVLARDDPGHDLMCGYLQAQWLESLGIEITWQEIGWARFHMLVKPWVKRYLTLPLRWWYWKDVVLEPHQPP